MNKVKTSKLLIAFMSIVSLCSCEMFDIHPYDGKINGETNLNSKNIAEIEELLAHRDTIRFAVISDTQRWYDETVDEVASINSSNDIDFVVHCGDLTDFGVTKEFEWQRDILQKLRMPYIVLLGNHDCIGSGKEVYRNIFGRENFSFVAGHTRFLCLDTNALVYSNGYNTTQACKHIEAEIVPGPERDYILNFIRNSDRGIIAGNYKT